MECGEPLPVVAGGATARQPRQLGFFGRLTIELATLLCAAAAALSAATFGQLYVAQWGEDAGLQGFAGRWLTHGGGLFLGAILGLLAFRWLGRELIRNLWGSVAIFVALGQACVRYYLKHFAADGVPAGWRPTIGEIFDFARDVSLPVVAAGVIVGLLAKSAGKQTLP